MTAKSKISFQTEKFLTMDQTQYHRRGIELDLSILGSVVKDDSTKCHTLKEYVIVEQQK